MPKKVIISNISKEEKEIIYVQIKDFVSSPHSSHLLTLVDEEINRIQNQQFQGSLLPDSFSYKDISLWWFFHMFVYKKFSSVLDLIENISEFIKNEKPVSIRLNTDFDKFPIIKQICEQENLEFGYSRIKYFNFKAKSYFKNILKKYAISYLFHQKIKKRKNLYKKFEKSNLNLNNKILFSVTQGLRREIFNFNNKKSEKGEYLIQDIIDLIQNRDNVICLDFFAGSRDKDNIFIERLKSEFHWIPLEIFYKKKNSSQKKEFFQRYNQTISSKVFQELFKFKQILIWDYLKVEFKNNLHASHLPYWIDLIDSLDISFSKNKPQLVIIPHESTPQNLALITACKKHNIQTFGLQHGVILKNQNGYSHKRLASKMDPLGFPFVDKFLVFGEMTKKILISNGYPLEKISVFGNPLYFNLEKKIKILKKIDLHKKYNIKKDTKIILHSSTAFQEGFFKNSKFNYDVQIWDYLLKNYGNNDQYQLILKTHPNESLTVYEKILEKYKFKNARIAKGNFIEIALISSLVISISSTTIFDTMVLKKPVIQVKFSNEIHLPSDDYQNAVLQTDLNNLSKNINLILSEKEIQTKLITGGSTFVRDFYNLIEINSELGLQKILNIDT